MNGLLKKLTNKLTERKRENALRKLSSEISLVDFSSNDYLGFSQSEEIFHKTYQYLIDQKMLQNGATGSRLLSGNHKLYKTVETLLCDFHHSESATIFNSGYDANIGFFSAVPQRNDIILYDEFIHASIRDGIRLSNAKTYSFKHNDLGDLENKLKRTQQDREIYIVTEAVFSMDGDSPDLKKMVQVSKEYKACLIVDEAHSIGVFGEKGEGLVQELNLEEEVFARIVTFGKALGCHGAAIIGSHELKEFLVNFARSLIYTTALPPHSLATIKVAYEHLIKKKNTIQKLKERIKFFNKRLATSYRQLNFIKSDSSIHCCIISGNEKVRNVAKLLQEKGYNVKPILSPTVSKEQERLRFCLHVYNSEEEIEEVLQLLTTFVV